MPTDDLEQKSDQELNELFAVEVAGYEAVRGLMHMEFTKDQEWLVCAQSYCSSADAVLPWLKDWTAHDVGSSVAICVTTAGYQQHFATARSFARAAVLAPIRAKRMEKKV